jgi:hypothetical protein
MIKLTRIQQNFLGVEQPGASSMYTSKKQITIVQKKSIHGCMYELRQTAAFPTEHCRVQGLGFRVFRV